MEFVFQLAVALLASFIQTVTGFGFALVMIPTMVAVTDAKSAVILTLALYMVVGSGISWNARKDIDRPLLTTLLLSSFFGLPLGAYVLVVISDTLLRLLIGIFIIAASLLLLFDYQRPFSSERKAAVVVGFLGGAINSCVTVCGPFVVLFLANQGLPKERLRATIAAFLLGITPPTLAILYFGGLVTDQLLGTALQLLPICVVGYLLGLWFLPRVNSQLFRRSMVVLVLFAGSSIFLSELRLLAGV